jgi:hypothetical protein
VLKGLREAGTDEGVTAQMERDKSRAMVYWGKRFEAFGQVESECMFRAMEQADVAKKEAAEREQGEVVDTARR